ncbi:hypothetical protein DEU56DRAFT_896527 [Suillus clintonianus]|uniref:uncharacterized protein n=1 Tax=Suillus clintonianus TaxID=1904413 RepID=UPI001B868082|nr:uncharacterized protein DEU56DRAFT_896527 [Suillus clintonianus]KAG2111835.1 hypothetical protein DEU56DRAFT_896527 [Suillus clintonianus]
MTLLQAYAVLVYIQLVCASLPSLNDTSIIHTLDTSDSPCSNSTRTLWNILLSCGLTLFACTWTAIHTNIPGMEESRVAITSRRVFLMVAALIAPELMITWATRQFFSARATAKKFNNEFGAQRAQTHSGDRDISEGTATLFSDIRESSSTPRPAEEFKEWTMTHGFFAWMGGFMLYVDGKPRVTLTPHELLEFVGDGYVDMPLISEAEINDRSKGDGLSKAIALLQLAWFVVQLVARYGQNLPITLLEIDTLAVAALTCVAYGLWWKKPKDVGCPYIIHWKARISPSDLTYDEADVGFFQAGWARSSIYIVYPFGSLIGVNVSMFDPAPRSHQVVSLGGYGKYHDMIVLLIGCFSGMVFGGIHCLGWNYLFQRHAEHILWRTASLGIVCAPVPLFLAIRYAMWMGNMGDFGMASEILVLLISPFIYIVARITLIVLMMLSLRSLPLGVYDTVAWTTFIPHFNM